MSFNKLLDTNFTKHFSATLAHKTNSGFFDALKQAGESYKKEPTDSTIFFL